MYFFHIPVYIYRVGMRIDTYMYEEAQRHTCTKFVSEIPPPPPPPRGMFSVVFFMFYICVICDCVCVLKYAIYLIWPRQFSFGQDSSHLAHVFLIWLIPWPKQKMSQRGPCYLSNSFESGSQTSCFLSFIDKISNQIC